MPRKKIKFSKTRIRRPSFHEKLSDFDIKINAFGEMESTLEIDQLNKFLDSEVRDRKIQRDHPEEEE